MYYDRLLRWYCKPFTKYKLIYRVNGSHYQGSQSTKFTQNVLAHFIAMVQQVMLPLFQNLYAVKAFVAAQSCGNNGDQDDEDDTNTVVNGEDNGAGEEIPQEEENNILNQEGDNPVPMPPHSQRNSKGSSKSLKIEGKSY